MSNTYTGLDDDMDENVDFDFFDTPKDPTESKLSPKQSKSVHKHEQNDRSGKHDRSRSASPKYSDDSDTDCRSKGSVKKIEAKLPVHHLSGEYSDHFDSDSDHNDAHDSNKKAPNPRKKDHKKHSDSDTDIKKRHAWSADSQVKDHSSKQNGIPKSGHPTRDRKNSDDHRRKKSYASDRTLSDNSSDFSTTDSDTDSDVTDVSPLNSPHRIPKSRNVYDLREMSKLGKPPKTPMHKEAVTYQKSSQRPSSAKQNQIEQLLNADSDQMDLKLLMQAVLEMEQGRETRQRQQRRVLFAPPVPKPQSKLNQTFDNDKVRTIDKENQRLMDRIMGYAKQAEIAKQKKKKPNPKVKEAPKLTPSAVNRNKEQRRIEQDNLVCIMYTFKNIILYNFSEQDIYSV